MLSVWILTSSHYLYGWCFTFYFTKPLFGDLRDGQNFNSCTLFMTWSEIHCNCSKMYSGHMPCLEKSYYVCLFHQCVIFQFFCDLSTVERLHTTNENCLASIVYSNIQVDDIWFINANVFRPMCTFALTL